MENEGSEIVKGGSSKSNQLARVTPRVAVGQET